jgi:hypothetical protein
MSPSTTKPLAMKSFIIHTQNTEAQGRQNSQSLQPQAADIVIDSKPAELDVIAEVREFIQQEMQLLENAENVDVACETMLQHCLKFRHARYPAMLAIIHYLKNICRPEGDKEYYTEYKDQEEPFEPWFPVC